MLQGFVLQRTWRNDYVIYRQHAASEASLYKFLAVGY